jgi:hypothetical protein
MNKPVEKFYLGIILFAIGAALANFLPLSLQIVGDAFSTCALVYLIIATIQLIKYKIDSKKVKP